MSKPNKPGELRNVEVEAISLVNKAANKERFKIFKSEKSEYETISKDERGLFTILKEFFTGEKIEKGAVSDIVNTHENGRKLSEAFNALEKVLGISFEDSIPETDPSIIMEAIDDFRDLAIEIFLGKNDVEKAGRKISGMRLAKIKEAHAILGNLIADTDTVLENMVSENTEGGTDTVTKEDLINEVKKSIEEAVKPINERLTALEKSDVVKDALKPITERLERVEKARGLSNSQPEDVNIKKSSDNFWAGAFGD